MTKPVFSVVIPTFRRPGALAEALDAFLRQDYPADCFEVIVVDDDGGAEATAVVSRANTDAVPVLVQWQERRGAAAARNRGARAARGEVLLFVDDDIIVGSDHLQRHAATLSGVKRTLVNGAWEFTPTVLAELASTPFGRYRTRLEKHFKEEALSKALRDGLAEMPMLGSWDLAVSRDLFWEIGGFDEAFPVAGAEDQDFSLRAKQAGCRLLLDENIICLHNDNRLDLKAYCAREERSARTMPIIARKFPDVFGDIPYVLENRPIRFDDSPALVAKKLAKAALAAAPVLEMLHWAVRVAEGLRVPDPILDRVYSTILGLHLYRGFRMSWQ